MTSPKITDKTKDAAIAWVLRLHSESCTPEERRTFTDWLDQNANHRKLYEHYDARWQALDRFKDLVSPIRHDSFTLTRKITSPCQPRILAIIG